MHYHLDQIKTFLQVVQDEGFSKAAHHLSVAQGTVSTRIRELEKEVGAELFVRQGRGIALSEAGQIFLPYAQRMMDIAENSYQEIHDSYSRIRLGAVESLAGDLLTDSIQQMTTRTPAMSVYLRMGHSNEIIQGLKDRTLNLGFIVKPSYPSQMWGYQELDEILALEEPISFVVSPNHPLAKQSDITFDDIAQSAAPLLYYEWGATQDAMPARLRSLWQNRLELPVHMIRHWLTYSTGAAFLVRNVVAHDIASGRLIELNVTDIPRLVRYTALVKLASRDLSAQSLEFVEIIKQTAGRLQMLCCVY